MRAPLWSRNQLVDNTDLAESPSGGHMNGCLPGRWVLGVAHGDSALPVTVVPVRTFRFLRC